jgi:hypothetical protein
MEALLGFHVGFWDYMTFGAMAVIGMAFLALAVFILGLPGRIAIARQHPEADAIYLKIFLDDPDQSKFPIGAQGTAAIYTSGEHGAWAALRKISIRAHAWLNWLYPINF